MHQDPAEGINRDSPTKQIKVPGLVVIWRENLRWHRRNSEATRPLFGASKDSEEVGPRGNCLLECSQGPCCLKCQRTAEIPTLWWNIDTAIISRPHSTPGGSWQGTLRVGVLSERILSPLKASSHQKWGAKRLEPPRTHRGQQQFELPEASNK